MIQDPRQMGDAELDAAIARLQGGQAPRPASPASPVAQMSDAELDAAIARAQSQTPHQTARQAPAQAPADPLAGYAETLRAEGIPESEIPDLSQAMRDEANGIFPAAPPVGSGQNADTIYVADELSPEQLFALGAGDRLRLPSGEVVTLRSQPVGDTNIRPTDRQVGRFNLREPNLQDQVAALSSAYTEQIPFGDDAIAGAVGLLSGEGYDAVRQNQLASREVLNQTEGALRDVGGVAGAAASLFAPGSSYIQAGQGIGRIGRAAAVGGGYGALFGAGNTDGDLQERGVAALINAALGAGGGALLQRGADGLAGAAAAARATPSPQRRLSQMGVQLTPGQMTGGAGQRLEDAATSVPILGDAIRNARLRGLESFNEVGINRALSDIGGSVTGAGRQAYRAGDDQISGAFTAATDDLFVPRTSEFDVNLTTVMRQNPLPADRQADFEAIVNPFIQRLDQGVDGQEWKRIDSELAAAVRSAQNGSTNDPGMAPLARKLDEVRGVFRGLVEQADPIRAQDIANANRSSAMMMRIRDAMQRQGSASRDGLFTPADLTAAVRAGDTSAGNRQFARGEALMQDLSDAAAQVLPSTVPDSGTPLRSLLTMGPIPAAGAIGAGVVNPYILAGIGAGLAGGSVAYGKTVQNVINAVYRAVTPGAARQALADLEALAAQTPALQPVYESLQSALRPLLLGERSATQNTP
jgi:hypothetical protein